MCFAGRIWRRLEALFFVADLELLRGLFWRLLKAFVQNLWTVIMDQHPLFLLAATIPFKLSFISSSLSKVCQVSRLFSLIFFFLVNKLLINYRVLFPAFVCHGSKREEGCGMGSLPIG